MSERSLDEPFLIPARDRDLGGFSVGRVLPAPARRHVGPFVFLDHIGPITVAPGRHVDVGPHPHIGLSTLTYLFEGEILHRDSLGSVQPIRAGEVNWMTAGRGIVHSERTTPEVIAGGGHVHGLQFWVALPRADEEMEPAFAHHGRDELPEIDLGGARGVLVAGTLLGARSPVAVRSPTFFVDVDAKGGARFTLPAEHDERGIYVIAGGVKAAALTIAPRELGLVPPGTDVTVEVEPESRVVLLGGAPLDGERHLFWNFVSSEPSRIEEATRLWKAGGFSNVPGDDGKRLVLRDDPPVRKTSA